MSEKVKLIIEIDAKTYNDIKVGKIYSSLRDVPLESANAIKNGIPLDDVKAEIEQILQGIDTVSNNEYENAVEQGKEIAYENVLSILDNIGKAESEDFPQAKDIEPTVKGFVDTMDILDNIIGKAESEGK